MEARMAALVDDTDQLYMWVVEVEGKKEGETRVRSETLIISMIMTKAWDCCTKANETRE